MQNVVIVGGGIAGLAAAYRLSQRIPGGQITLVESDSRLGGKIVTDRVDGFVVEGGPDTFLAYKPRGVGLCRELGLGERLHGTNQQVRRTYVLLGGRLHVLPEGLTGLIPSRFGPFARTTLISPWGKLRMGLDVFIPARSPNGDESLAHFVSRRLGREVYENLIEPLLSGIYAGDGEQLSLRATFPQLRQAELQHGSLVRSMLAGRKRSNGAAPASAGSRSAFLTPTTGLAEMVEALEARLRAAGVVIRLDTRIAQLSQAAAPAGGYELSLASGEALWAAAVVLATPGFTAADLLEDLDADLAAHLRAIPYVSTATVSLAYPLSDIPRALDGYGYIVPRAEGRPVLACTWTSTKFPHRAPGGYGLLRAFLGRAGQPDVLARSDDELIGLVRAELYDVLGIRAEPALTRIFRWPQAMPQYTLGHVERLAAIDERVARLRGLALAGNAYRGIGIPDCIASGEAAAERMLQTTLSHELHEGSRMHP
jgi:oxygen-dependent protoporphyrinogen oxidase